MTIFKKELCGFELKSTTVCLAVDGAINSGKDLDSSNAATKSY